MSKDCPCLECAHANAHFASMAADSFADEPAAVAGEPGPIMFGGRCVSCNALMMTRSASELMVCFDCREIAGMEPDKTAVSIHRGGPVAPLGGKTPDRVFADACAPWFEPVKVAADSQRRDAKAEAAAASKTMFGSAIARANAAGHERQHAPLSSAFMRGYEAKP